MPTFISVAAAVVIIGFGPTLSGQTARADSIATSLTKYAEGDRTVVGPSAVPQDWPQYRQAFDRAAIVWIAAASSAEGKTHRRLMAATFGLELASNVTAVGWAEARHLVEWGCRVLARDNSPATAEERAWHIAAMSLIEGAGDTKFLIYQSNSYSYTPKILGDAYDHVSHALARFPGEPRFRLARAVALERDTFPEPDREEPWETDWKKLRAAKDIMEFSRDRGISVAPPTPQRAREFDRRTKMLNLIDEFAVLADDPVVGTEARVRMAKLRARLRMYDDALRTLASVNPATTDKFTLHLSQFFTGEIMEVTGRQSAAADAYAAALKTWPGAQSAGLSLATRLAADGKPTAAAEIVQQVVNARADVTGDPWRQYGYGSYRMWPELLVRLRTVVGIGAR